MRLYLQFLSLRETSWLCLLVAQRNFPRFGGRILSFRAVVGASWLLGVITFPGPSDGNRHLFSTGFPFQPLSSVFVPLSSKELTFFLFLFRFLGPYPWQMEVPWLGVKSGCQPTPQPQQVKLRAASAVYTIAHSSARSLTH